MKKFQLSDEAKDYLYLAGWVAGGIAATYLSFKIVAVMMGRVVAKELLRAGLVAIV